jgi:hypothetical protein
MLFYIAAVIELAQISMNQYVATRGEIIRYVVGNEYVAFKKCGKEPENVDRRKPAALACRNPTDECYRHCLVCLGYRNRSVNTRNIGSRIAALYAT